MLKYLAILDYCNNAHDDYEGGVHIFEYSDGGELTVQIDDEEIIYKLSTFAGATVEEGVISSVKQLRELHNNGWKLLPTE